MISSLWNWFIIGLVVAGFSSGIVLLVIFLYLFTINSIIADKLTSTLTFAKHLASYSLECLRF